MRQQFLVAAGGSLNAASLPAGEIMSITVDNRSGSWLRVYPSYSLIPPYTLGYAENFGNRLANVSVRSETGPAGQLSTTVGDPFTVFLDSGPNVPSGGVPFVTRSDQPERSYYSATTAGMLGLGGASTATAILGGSITKRLRIYSVIWIVDPTSPANRLSDMIRIITAETTNPVSPNGIVIADDYLHGNRQRMERIYTDALDLQLGSEVTFSWFAPAPYSVNTFMQLELQYSVF